MLLHKHLQWCSIYDPQNIFFTCKFSYLLFSNPTHNKTETGRTANRWGTTNSKPCGTNHYDRPIRNTEQQHSDQFITLFSWFTELLWQTSASHHKNCAIMRSQNYFSDPNPHFFFWLFFNQSYCAGSSHSEHHWRRSYFMSFAMEHMKDSHLWWFYVFFFLHQTLDSPIRELARIPLWLCSQDLVWFHLATSTPIIIFLVMLKFSIYLFIYSKKNVLWRRNKESFRFFLKNNILFFDTKSSK